MIFLNQVDLIGLIKKVLFFVMNFFSCYYENGVEFVVNFTSTSTFLFFHFKTVRLFTDVFMGEGGGNVIVQTSRRILNLFANVLSRYHKSIGTSILPCFVRAGTSPRRKHCETRKTGGRETRKSKSVRRNSTFLWKRASSHCSTANPCKGARSRVVRVKMRRSDKSRKRVKPNEKARWLGLVPASGHLVCRVPVYRDTRTGYLFCFLCLPLRVYDATTGDARRRIRLAPAGVRAYESNVFMRSTNRTTTRSTPRKKATTRALKPNGNIG